MDKDEMKNRISLALKDPILQQGFEIICKENAELKEHLKCLIVGMYHIAQHHPTMGAHTKIMQDLREAEQFLKDSEVEECGQ